MSREKVDVSILVEPIFPCHGCFQGVSNTSKGRGQIAV